VNNPAPRRGASSFSTNHVLPLDGGGFRWGWASLFSPSLGEDLGGGGPLYFHPPLAPPIKGGGFKRMPFIPALKCEAFWHDLVNAASGI